LFCHLLISFAQWRNYAIIWIVANGYWPGNVQLGSPFAAIYGSAGPETMN
jgi:hypothetical protein